MHLVLASASPARLATLRAAGVDPVVAVSGVDEPALLAELGSEATGPDTVTALALAKARAVAARVGAQYPDAVVVGADSMLELDGELVGKPDSPQRVRERWARMAGRAGELLTGHALIRLRDGAPAGELVGHAATVVSFGRPTAAELEAYIASGEPMAVAGAFTLDGRGGWFVEGIEGDASNVIGLSLPLLRRLLGELDLAVTDLWTAPGPPPPSPPPNPGPPDPGPPDPGPPPPPG